ncbi:hypothetical protein CR513_60324, partial [Mucuna pruriens]
MDRSMIDAKSGGALMDKMPVAARHLILNMANNTQQFGTRGTITPRMVNEVGTIDNLRLENQFTELTSLVRQLAIGEHQPFAVINTFGICTSVEHHTDMCPTLQETESDHSESVGSIGGYQYGKQLANNSDDHHTRRTHIKGRMQLKDLVQTGACPRAKAAINSQIQDTRCHHSNNSSSRKRHHQIVASNLEFRQTMSSNNLQFQQNMSAIVQDLKTQVGQLANSVSQLQLAGSGNLPSQTISNPRGNASVASPVPIPFRSRTLSARKPESDEELLKMFQKVEINIPLLDSIKQIPKYAKFLKELCMYKRKKMKGGVELGGIVSALTRNDDLIASTRQALPKKYRDPRIFSVPCTIGDCTFADAMLDLGASINVIPTSIFKSLNCGDLELTRMTIQLANRSVIQPLCVLEDVLVQVDELIFPTDFYVLDMEDETPGKGSTLILGRPFLMTAKTKIDVHAGTLSM